MVLNVLGHAQHHVQDRLEQALEAEGLSIAKFSMLKALGESCEPLPLGQLAEQLACVRSNITQLVDRLETDGLAQRVPDPDDRRGRRAAITAEGRRRYEIGKRVEAEIEEQLLKNLTLQEQEELAIILEKLGAI